MSKRSPLRAELWVKSYALWLLIRLFAELPGALIILLAKRSVSLHKLFAPRNWQRLKLNIHLIWQLPPHSYFAKLFARQVARSQVCIALESIKAMLKPERLRLDGWEELRAQVERVEAAGRGYLVITGHVGSWELVAFSVAKASKKGFYALAKPSRSPAMTQVLEWLRAKMATHVLWTGQRSLARQMLELFAKGACLGFVMDQKPQLRQGLELDFFGRATSFVSGPANLAIKGDRPVLAVFCVRVGNMHYRLLSKIMLEAEHGQRDVKLVTQAFAAEIERVIRLYPEQWCWDYKRWRDKPASS